MRKLENFLSNLGLTRLRERSVTYCTRLSSLYKHIEHFLNKGPHEIQDIRTSYFTKPVIKKHGYIDTEESLDVFII